MLEDMIGGFLESEKEKEGRLIKIRDSNKMKRLTKLKVKYKQPRSICSLLFPYLSLCQLIQINLYMCVCVQESNYAAKPEPIGNPWQHDEWQAKWDSCVGTEEANLRKTQSNAVQSLRRKLSGIADSHNGSGFLHLTFPNGGQHSKYVIQVGHYIDVMEEKGGIGDAIKKVHNRIADNIQGELSKVM